MSAYISFCRELQGPGHHEGPSSQSNREVYRQIMGVVADSAAATAAAASTAPFSFPFSLPSSSSSSSASASSAASTPSEVNALPSPSDERALAFLQLHDFNIPRASLLLSAYLGSGGEVSAVERVRQLFTSVGGRAAVGAPMPGPTILATTTSAAVAAASATAAPTIAVATNGTSTVKRARRQSRRRRRAQVP